MKRILSIATLFAVLAMFSLNAEAQNDTGNISVGAGVGYGFDLEEIGINVNGYYSITPEIRAGVDFLYYLLEQPDQGSIDFWELNINGHYLFVNDAQLRVYALAGINYANSSVSGGGMSISASSTGINLGAGLEYYLGGVSIFAEPRFALSGSEQLVVTAGARFTF